MLACVCVCACTAKTSLQCARARQTGCTALNLTNQSSAECLRSSRARGLLRRRGGLHPTVQARRRAAGARGAVRASHCREAAGQGA